MILTIDQLEASIQDSYYFQNGTTAWHSVIWQNVEVVPAGAVFDAANSNPTVKCLIYDFIISATDLFNLPLMGASVSVTLPNNVTIGALTGIDGYAVFTMIPQGRFAATVSYSGQITTATGDIAIAAANPASVQIPFSIPVIMSILVPAILACLVIIMVGRRKVIAT